MLLPWISFAEGIVLEGTRVIYKATTKTKTVKIKNTDKETTFLVQSWIEKESGGRALDFILTPPVFKSIPDSDNIIKIKYVGEMSLPEDKESIFFLNVKAIPSIDKELISNHNVMVLAIKTRIKLIYRPVQVQDYKDKDIPDGLKFYRKTNNLYVYNQTPYFITLTNIQRNNLKIKDVMVRPYAETKLKENFLDNTISYSFINDYGTLVGVKDRNVERK